MSDTLKFELSKCDKPTSGVELNRAAVQAIVDEIAGLERSLSDGTLDTKRLDWIALVCDAEENVNSAPAITDEVAENLRDFYLRAVEHATPAVALRAAVDACMEGRKPE